MPVARQVRGRRIQRTIRLADSSLHPALILSPLADLRSALAAASAEDQQSYRPQRRVPINGAPPHILTFACNDTRVLLGFVDGSIHVYASDQLLFSGEGPVQPIHVFATSSSVILLSIQPNPGDIPELVAVLRDCTNSPGSLAVELFDVQKHTSSGGWMAGKSPSTTPTSSAYDILSAVIQANCPQSLGPRRASNWHSASKVVISSLSVQPLRLLRSLAYPTPLQPIT